MGQNFKFFLKFLEGIKLHWLFHVGFREIKFSKWRDVCNQSKFLVFGNIKRVFRRFAFIQANIFFLKIKKDFNKNQYFMSPLLEHRPTCIKYDTNCGKIRYVSDP